MTSLFDPPGGDEERPPERDARGDGTAAPPRPGRTGPEPPPRSDQPGGRLGRKLVFSQPDAAPPPLRPLSDAPPPPLRPLNEAPPPPRRPAASGGMAWRIALCAVAIVAFVLLNSALLGFLPTLESRAPTTVRPMAASAQLRRTARAPVATPAAPEPAPLGGPPPRSEASLPQTPPPQTPPPAAPPAAPVVTARAAPPPAPAAPVPQPQRVAAAPTVAAPTPVRPAPVHAAPPAPPPAAPARPTTLAAARPAPPAAAPPQAAPPAAPKVVASGLAVQVGAFKTEALAAAGLDKALAAAEGAQGLSRRQEPTVKDGATLYRALISGFPDSGSATQFCSALKAKNIPCFVKR